MSDPIIRLCFLSLWVCIRAMEEEEFNNRSLDSNAIIKTSSVGFLCVCCLPLLSSLLLLLLLDDDDDDYENII